MISFFQKIFVSFFLCFVLNFAVLAFDSEERGSHPGAPSFVSQEIDFIPEKTTINLMWIHETKQDSILPKQIKRKYKIAAGVGEQDAAGVGEQDFFINKTQFFDPVTVMQDWKKVTGCSVNFWYDSKMLNGSVDQKPFEGLDVTLKDIRTLDFVQKNPTLFTEDVNVYARCDLAREFAAQETLAKNPDQIFVYADFSVGRPKSYESLMDEKTQDLLKQHGRIFGKSFWIPNLRCDLAREFAAQETLAKNPDQIFVYAFQSLMDKKTQDLLKQHGRVFGKSFLIPNFENGFFIAVHNPLFNAVLMNYAMPSLQSESQETWQILYDYYEYIFHIIIGLRNNKKFSNDAEIIDAIQNQQSPEINYQNLTKFEIPTTNNVMVYPTTHAYKKN